MKTDIIQAGQKCLNTLKAFVDDGVLYVETDAPRNGVEATTCKTRGETIYTPRVWVIERRVSEILEGRLTAGDVRRVVDYMRLNAPEVRP